VEEDELVGLRGVGDADLGEGGGLALVPPCLIGADSQTSGLAGSEEWRPVPGWEGVYEVSDQRPERTTMHNELATRQPTGLAISSDQTWWNERQSAALAQIGVADAPQADQLVFLHYCQRTGLDPFARQI
jgi:hypothetical protein